MKLSIIVLLLYVTQAKYSFQSIGPALLFVGISILIVAPTWSFVMPGLYGLSLITSSLSVFSRSILTVFSSQCVAPKKSAMAFVGGSMRILDPFLCHGLMFCLKYCSYRSFGLLNNLV